MRKLPAVPTYYAMQAIFGLMFTGMAVVSAVYRVQVVHLNAIQLVLVGTVLEAAYFLAEVPTGVIADVYSRKLSLIIGYILIGLGFIVEGLFPTFATVLLAQVIWGVGATFTSGAEEAWIAGEIGEGKLAHIMIRSGQIGQIVSILGVLLGMSIGAFDLGLAFVITGLGILLLGLALIVLMPEEHFQPATASDRDTWGKLADTFRSGLSFVRASRLLVIVFAIELSFGLSSEGIDRLSEPHLLQSFLWPTLPAWQPVVWLGLIQITNSLLTIGLTEWLRRHTPVENSLRTVRIMQVLAVGFLFAILAFAFARSFTMGVLAMILLAQTRRGGAALWNPWVTGQIAPGVRATVISMWGQMNAIGQMIGGPLIGALATATTLPRGYATIALLLLPVPFLFSAAANRIQRGGS